MRPRPLITAALVVIMATGVAACGASGEPEEPNAGGGSDDEGVVLIAQGQSPNINGLAISLSSVREDEAAMQIFGHSGETEIVRGRPGTVFSSMIFRVDVVDVQDNDEGGFVKVRVIAPEDE